MKPIVLVVGTRAEALKLMPIYQELKLRGINTVLCATFQHSNLLQQVFDLFNVIPDYNLDVMKHDQDLFHITTAVLERCRRVYQEVTPSLVLVHGDTTTTLAAALAAFYLHIPIGHVEAGLRTGDMHHPFPEEMNRKVVGQIATYHFAPTALATANILAEGAQRHSVFCTGNTIVDALEWVKKAIITGQCRVDATTQKIIAEAKQLQKQIVLFTAHRRESFSGGLDRIFAAFKEFASEHPDVVFFYPQHPNPNVQLALARSGLNTIPNIILSAHLAYHDLIYILMNSDWVATDSGGIQEEAVSLGKRVLCLRDVTERHEGVWEGFEILVGTDKQRILDGMSKFYSKPIPATSHSTLYGDGNAARRIVTIVQSCLPQILNGSDALEVAMNKAVYKRIYNQKPAQGDVV